ncbi:T9SS type A sorting domain-containing protein [Flavobacterium selenitireducens]|uniref:T9SS type A sorting domain-containing protein n=1 Tax=Flavobacterium selenitireducens TaxID=2722704 RepID=UPI00168BBECF|nr:T9SS type A sorting domain-containing protein [Flavobacterium selenitireducens]MBD3581350.1 T9SS type A sorting domain-containing protein [Flavobacterium selenitireducens]
MPPVSDCSDGDQIQNVSFAGINNDSGCDSAEGYSDFTAGTAASVVSGSTYTLSVTVGDGGDEVVGAYIDFNQNQLFEETEFFYVGTTPSGTLTTSIAIPASALAGSTRMRIRTFYNIWGDDPETLYLDFGDGSCVDVTGLDEFGEPSYSETEDYTINVTAGTPCDGTPTISDATATETSVCGSTTFTVSASVSGTSIGFSYQLQSSTDGGETWNDVGDAQSTGVFEVTGQAAATSYRVTVTCTDSGLSASSTPISVAQNDGADCLCTSNESNPFDCNDGDLILNVTIGSINNDSECGDTDYGYSDFTGTIAALEAEAGESYPISVTTGNGFSSESVGVWIDYNQDYIFSEDEFTYIGTGNATDGYVVTGNIAIPTTALDGPTRMRVVVAAAVAANFTWEYACGPLDPESFFGEMEDYLINVTNDLATGEFDKGIVGIYPNPAQDVLNIEVASGATLNTVEIYNVTGQKVMQQTFVANAQNTMNVQTLAAGVYIVKLATDQGTSSQRLVKK